MITKAALDAKLRGYKQNEPEAVKIRDEINAEWEQIRPLLASLAKMQEEVTRILEETSVHDSRIYIAAQRHLLLVGENVRAPRVMIPRQVYDFTLVGSHVGPLKPWRFISQKERDEVAAKRKAEAEAAMFDQMNSLIQIADSTTNATLAAQDYKQAEQIAINLYMYVYTIVPNNFWVVKPYMNEYQGQISYQENPMFGGGGIGLYFWWVKTCGSIQACSGRNIGP